MGLPICQASVMNTRGSHLQKDILPQFDHRPNDQDPEDQIPEIPAEQRAREGAGPIGFRVRAVDHNVSALILNYFSHFRKRDYPV